MRKLRDVIQEYKENNKALGHFNVSDSNQLEAVARAARETGLPVLIGLSEGERGFFPLTHAYALITEYRSEGLELFLNADHTYSIENVENALKASIDSIVVDGARLSYDENIDLTKRSVSLARKKDADTLVEGELGYIGSSSNVMDSLPEGAVVTEEMMTRPDELVDFVSRTSVDLVAPAVGNIHGIVTKGQPKLSIERIRDLASAVTVPIVLHGGSGSSDQEFVQAVKAGAVIIHINTDLRVLYKEGIERSEKEHMHEVAPYKILEPVVEAMRSYVAQKMLLFKGE